MICSHSGRKCCNRPANGRSGKFNKCVNIPEGRWVGREGLTAEVVGLAETDPARHSCVLCLGPGMTGLRIGVLLLGVRILGIPDIVLCRPGIALAISEGQNHEKTACQLFGLDVPCWPFLIVI